MKKLVISMIAATLAVMLAAPLYAADNLELSGSYFARGWSIDNAGGADGVDSDYIDQRFRMQGTINVADDVSAVIRADFAESVWGDSMNKFGANQQDDGGNFSRPTEATEIQIDRTYINIDKEMWSLSVGQQYMGLGMLEVLDSNVTGAIGRIKAAPVEVSLIYGKLDEGLSYDDDASDSDDDLDIYGINGSFQMGAFDSNVFYAMVNGYTNDATFDALTTNTVDLNSWVAGFHTQGSIGGVNLVAEIATFGGEIEDTVTGGDADLVGTQAYLHGSYAVNDMVTIGGELLWAAGNDDDDEIQIHDVTAGTNDWATINTIVSNTPQDGWYSPFVGFSPFQYQSDSGVEGITFYVDATPLEKLSIGSKFSYLQAEEEDTVALDYDSISVFNLYASYEIATNTDLSLTYVNANPDEDDAVNDETVQALIGQIALSF